MRIPYPKLIPFRKALVFLTVVLFIQLLEGTNPFFGLLMMVAQIAGIEAFNRMGGMTHMAGAFCLFVLLPDVTVPELTHAVLGQPGDFNLEYPLITAGVCAVFFICVMGAAMLVSVTKPAKPYLERISFSIIELQIVSALAAVMAAGITFAVFTHEGPMEDGTLLTGLSHFLAMLPVISLMLATYVRLAVTDNRSAMSWYVALLLIVAEVPGVLGASKEGMLAPVFCWLVVVAACGHRLRVPGVAALIGFAVLIWAFIYPFSQNARFPVRQATTISDKVNLIGQFIRDPSQFPDGESKIDEGSEFGVRSSQVSILYRFSLLKSIDMLVGADLRGAYTSIDRYLPALVSFVPHALWPDRPLVITTNELGHKAGFPIGDEDTDTGIEIGSPALFFDVGGWPALVVYTIICFWLFFYATVRLVGKTSSGIWALVPIGSEVHAAAGASPAAMFGLLVMYLGMFFIVVATLKITGYLGKALISRSVSISHTRVG